MRSTVSKWELRQTHSCFDTGIQKTGISWAQKDQFQVNIHTYSLFIKTNPDNNTDEGKRQKFLIRQTMYFKNCSRRFKAAASKSKMFILEFLLNGSWEL
jgi:hypothetical protein